jgi:ActR/RegA family two-component response regulator
MAGNDQLQAILVSNDMKTLYLMDRALDPFQIKTEVFAQHRQAYEFLRAHSTDLVIFDWTSRDESGPFAQGVREMARRQVLLCIANTSAAMQEALGAGAHFVCPPPESVEQITALLRAASGLILHNRRQSFRLEVSFEASVRGLERDLSPAHILNLSENGLCAQLSAPVQVGETLSFLFRLPGSTPVSTSARVCWTKDGRAGVQLCPCLRLTRPH